MQARLGTFALRSVPLLLLAGVAMLTTSPSADAAKRTFTILAVEPKGGTTTDKEPFPTEVLPAGGGYVVRQPDQSGRWEVSGYVWQPSQIVVTEGDEVTLEFVGINGREHPTTLSAFGQTFTVKRGQLTRVTFVASKAGVFGFVCSAHRPSMTGELIVLPKP
jgi:hypothetical protein